MLMIKDKTKYTWPNYEHPSVEDVTVVTWRRWLMFFQKIKPPLNIPGGTNSFIIEDLHLNNEKVRRITLAPYLDSLALAVLRQGLAVDVGSLLPKCHCPTRAPPCTGSCSRYTASQVLVHNVQEAIKTKNFKILGLP